MKQKKQSIRATKAAQKAFYYYHKNKNKQYRRKVARAKRSRKDILLKRKKAYIKSPKFYTFITDDAQNSICKFLKKIRSAFLFENSINIDFSGVKEIHPYAMLLIFSEIHRLKEIVPQNKEYHCIPPKDVTACKVFQKIGLCELLNISSNHTITNEDDSVFHWMESHGEGNAVRLAKNVLRDIKTNLPSRSKAVMRAMIEAMDNSSFHAYEIPRGDEFHTDGKKRWWAFSQIKDDRITIVFCDLGAGIPKTLPLKLKDIMPDIKKGLLNVTGKKRDLALLKLATTTRRTSTNMEHRGRGFPQMMEAAESLSGSILIMSNRALMFHDFMPIESDIEPHILNYPKPPIYKKPQSRAFKRSIMGTIIQWSIPLTPPSETDDEQPLPSTD